MNLENLAEDLHKQPYGITVQIIQLNNSSYVAKIINFAHLQINNDKALGFSIDLHFKIGKNNQIYFDDDGNLFQIAIESIKIIYNLQLKQTKIKKINVIPIYTGGLVRYMNNSNSMFHYLKPVNTRSGITQYFSTQGYLNLKKAIAEYAVMALSIIHYTEVTLRNQVLYDKNNKRS